MSKFQGQTQCSSAHKVLLKSHHENIRVESFLLRLTHDVVVELHMTIRPLDQHIALHSQ